MRDVPKGGLIGKTVHTLRRIQALKVSLYAANACFFLVLAVFPALMLLLSLLRYTPLEVERLAELFSGILPEALLEGAEELILLTYDNSSGAMVGVSAAAALWSASRGIHGVLTGLNAICGVEEDRGYFRTRLISAGYTLAFLVLLLLTLGLQVFGCRLKAVLGGLNCFPAGLLRVLPNSRFLLLMLLQTGFFALMFLVLPNRKSCFSRELPGAMLASLGWLTFSKGYSVYVEHFAHLSNVYGSVYAVALSMLWLYCCMSIVFYGGAWNVLLQKKKKNVSET